VQKTLVLNWNIHVGSQYIAEISFSGVPDLREDGLWQKQHTGLCTVEGDLFHCSALAFHKVLIPETQPA